MAGPEFYNVPEVAKMLRVSRTTVHRMIHREEIPAVRIGAHFRIPVKGILTYLERSVFIPGEKEDVA